MRELNAAYAALRGGREDDAPAPPPPPPAPPSPTPPPAPRSRGRTVAVAGVAVALLVIVLAALAASGSDTVPEPAAAELVAAGRVFAPAEVRLRADAPVQLRLVNRDAGYRHNVVVTLDGVPVARGEPYTGPSAVAYELGPLPAGTYELRCEVYRSMTARLVVSGADR